MTCLEMTCPKCGKDKAYRSHRTTWEAAISWLSLKPYRCQACQHRFYAHRGGAISSRFRTPEERRIVQLRRGIRWRRIRNEALLYGVSSLILLGILYYIVQQHVA